MYLLLLIFALYSDVCYSQMVYSRMVPYDSRYLLHRPPVRRSAMEALERLRMPVTRYFPQIDGSASYKAAAPSYADDIYAIPSQWTDDLIAAEEPSDNENDYGNYEYENAFSPVYRPAAPPAYADEIYVPQEPVVEREPANNAYNDFMMNYFLENSEPVAAPIQPEEFELQRRSDSSFSANNGRQGMIQLSNVIEANKNANNTQKIDTTQAPSAPLPSQVPPQQVQMTAVPAAPEKKELKSLVIPAPIVESRDESEDPWRTLGQKEEPLFRPLQNSQKTTWEVLTRAKNSVQKRPIPLLKKMIQNSQPKKIVDPLTEELKNLKKEHV